MWPLSDRAAKAAWLHEIVCSKYMTPSFNFAEFDERIPNPFFLFNLAHGVKKYEGPKLGGWVGGSPKKGEIFLFFSGPNNFFYGHHLGNLKAPP